jgi:hypothetical protein
MLYNTQMLVNMCKFMNKNSISIITGNIILWLQIITDISEQICCHVTDCSRESTQTVASQMEDIESIRMFFSSDNTEAIYNIFINDVKKACLM